MLFKLNHGLFPALALQSMCPWRIDRQFFFNVSNYTLYCQARVIRFYAVAQLRVEILVLPKQIR
ncbi:hypothetical protein SAMN03159315_01992 [Pseudomonas sp. NFPP28]|nr:hypothetical protein SAMN03159485_05215 [Pseudomonas sp. NFPP24]SFP14568.1 hypothetical protein SAMN03159315_01992 [Pseudomonas sp. NFPP28]